MPQRFPEIPSALVAELDRLFPDRLPRASTEAFELGRLVGHQEVIDVLRRHLTKQEER